MSALASEIGSSGEASEGSSEGSGEFEPISSSREGSTFGVGASIAAGGAGGGSAAGEGASGKRGAGVTAAGGEVSAGTEGEASGTVVVKSSWDLWGYVRQASRPPPKMAVIAPSDRRASF